MSYQARIMLAAIAIIIAGCGGENTAGSRTPPADNPTADCTSPISNGGEFTHVSLELGLCYALSAVEAGSEMQMMGGGLALNDIDNDGLLELYVAHGHNEKGRLYSYNGTDFQPVSDNAGITLNGLDVAGYFVDIDGDGFDDFISIQYLENMVQVFRNDQNGGFVDVTTESNIYHRKPTFSMAAGDYDLDGDLDLFFAHWGWVPVPGTPFTEYLWENDGNGSFTDVSYKVEIITSLLPPFDDIDTEHSFTPIFADVNSDGYPDLLLTGDHLSTQVLINNAGVSFTDATTAEISDENGMGATVIDYDFDGDLDWFVSSIYYGGRDPKYIGGQSGNRLYENDGNGSFTDVTDVAGVRDGAWGWGACFADFDNDGNPDIFHTNGMRQLNSLAGNEDDPLYPFFEDWSRLFMSNGNGQFVEQAFAAGMNHREQGRGVVCTDLNDDGLVDILIANVGDSPSVYRNQFAASGHYIKIDLIGPGNNKKAIGARVSVETTGKTQMQEVFLGNSYLSQSPATLHFGLGDESNVIAIDVRWPDEAGTVSRVENVAADKTIIIVYQ